MANIDTSFALAGLDAFHLVVPSSTYWNDFRPDNRSSTKRFLLKPGWRTVYAHHLESAILRVSFTDGTIGWGEVTEPICPEVICRIAAELIVPLAGGIEFADPGELWNFGYELNRCRGQSAGYHCLTMGALDTAVWDAIGRRAGLPVSSIISDRPRDSITVYMSGVRRATRPARAAAIKEAAADGLTAAKLFIDADLEEATRELEAMREAVGEDFTLATDALWSFESLSVASAAKSRLAEWHVAWLECPMVPEDLAGHQALMKVPGTPIALGEHFTTHYQSIPWLASNALDVFQPDISRTGFSNGLRQKREAEEHEIVVTPHMGSGSPVVQAIAMQFWAACSGTAPCEYQSDLAPVLPDVFDSGWSYAHGRVKVPDRPGLGIEVDAEGLARHSDSVQKWRLE